jgi:phosphatidylserine decarboxylase
MIFTKYGTDNIIFLLFVAIVLILIGYVIHYKWLSILFYILGIMLTMFTLWFFRDPDRNIPEKIKIHDNIILSPADGKVISIEEVTENVFLKSKAIKISIFLSPLDVHVNRIPISGIIKYFKYNPGDYLIASYPKSSEKNEQTHIGIETKYGKVFFKQITGILARRLVWDIKEGDTVHAGNRFGMMKFGSRIDIMLDSSTEINVKLGSKVRGGESEIARLHEKTNIE